mmetsp:Transcript_79020/g.203554  ORF Transcript_79020/g.203554 Transcript_79020/m.203554 type:complete len:238 (+) Transcript_79020:245-958(+)
MALSRTSAEAILASLDLSWAFASARICSKRRFFSSSLIRRGAPLLAKAASFDDAILASCSARLSTTMPLGPNDASLEPRVAENGEGDRFRFAGAWPGSPRPSIRHASGGAPPGQSPVTDSSLSSSSLLEDFLPPFLATVFSFLAAFLAAFFSFLAAFLAFFNFFFASFSSFFLILAMTRGLAIMDSFAACSCRRIWNSGSSLSFRSMSSLVLVALLRNSDPAVLSCSFFMSARSLSF